MSKIDYCPKGGQEGILVDEWEQEKFANYINVCRLDKYIPLPGVDPEIQKQFIETCTCDENDMGLPVYWENDKGSHGWCCVQCGRVQQWG